MRTASQTTRAKDSDTHRCRQSGNGEAATVSTVSERRGTSVVGMSCALTVGSRTSSNPSTNP
eukprot:2521589-Rhodomonas_salina.5